MRGVEICQFLGLIWGMSLSNRSKTEVAIKIDDRLLLRAQEYGIDLTNCIEQSLKIEISKRWNAENAEAIELNRERIENEGLWSDGLRLF
jgi:post-segregation antitoxin (ccd killing protein)